MERVSSSVFLGTCISQDLTWNLNITALVRKAQQQQQQQQQQLGFLRTLKRVNLSQQLLLSIYQRSIESILTYGTLVGFGGYTTADRKALLPVPESAQKFISTQIASPEGIYNARCLCSSTGIIREQHFYLSAIRVQSSAR